MKNIICFLMVMFFGCSDASKFEYYIKSVKLAEIGLLCDDNEALRLAEKAVGSKYPGLIAKLRQHKFSIFDALYSGRSGYVYSLKSIFNYYSVGKDDSGEFFEESVEVLMDKNCKVDDVIYFKGNAQITI